MTSFAIIGGQRVAIHVTPVLPMRRTVFVDSRGTARVLTSPLPAPHMIAKPGDVGHGGSAQEAV